MPSLICKTLALTFLLGAVNNLAFAQHSHWLKAFESHYNANLHADTGKLFKIAKKHITRPDSTHKPALAVKRSAIIPGWGQLYNRNWWKVPLVYTTLGLFGQSVVVNQRGYRQYLEVYKLVKDPRRQRPPVGSPVRTLYERYKKSDLAQLDAIQSNYQRNTQLSILGMAGFWGLQVIDAYIEAKFIHSYSIDRNLSVNITPSIATTGTTYTAGNVPAVMPIIKLLVTI
jgi:hypothetical protein